MSFRKMVASGAVATAMLAGGLVVATPSAPASAEQGWGVPNSCIMSSGTVRGGFRDGWKWARQTIYKAGLVVSVHEAGQVYGMIMKQNVYYYFDYPGTYFTC